MSVNEESAKFIVHLEAQSEEWVQAKLDGGFWAGPTNAPRAQDARVCQRKRAAEDSAETRRIANRANWIALGALLVSGMVGVLGVYVAWIKL